MASSKERKRKVKQRQTRQRTRKVPTSQEEGGGPQRYTIHHRAKKLAQIIATYPNQIAEGLASREDAGWVFGRLYLVGAIDYDQKAAAERFDRAVATYRRLLHKQRSSGMRAVTTPLGPVFDTDQIGGSSSQEDLSPAAEKRFEKAKKEYDRHMDVLKACGEDVVKEMFTALETDMLRDLVLVHRGLSALCVLRGRTANLEHTESPLT